MEEGSKNSNIIIITGAESTGKTELTKQLASHYSCNWVPELSRQYIEDLNFDYTYADVEQIAKLQIQQFSNSFSKNKRAIFDTGLIITKVWMDVVYNASPNWLIETIREMPKVLHLLCDIDLPWVPDPVRENGGEMRGKLHDIYQNELKYFNQPYTIVSGHGDQRLKNAVSQVEAYEQSL